jgi:hypothetical protein
VATGDFKEISEISGDFSRYFVQESDEQLQRTLGTEVFQGEFTIDENLTAFDTSPIFQRTDTPNEYKPEPPEPATTVKRISGANWYVYNGLKNITFVPGTACQMSQVIAYIRYWSRGGTADKTPVETEEQSTVPTDPQEKMSDELNNNYYKSAEAFDDTPQPVETKTVLTVPDNSAYQSRPRQPIPVQVPDTKTQPSPKAGKVFSANPSGVTSVREVIEAPNPTDAVWMFLFNPEELQLSSGPDYNRAETWGVSDPKNSGQPLSWRSNRNRKLSFGKVLLHGYTFGKRVDSLESGLQQLFMARDGENGSDGPPVLEFVWGKRIFGPCVIQNIQVKEKAWDKGILVNAEVSFELEQVPEWTINDGYVDILRPGRQPLVNDPLLPQGDYKDTGTSGSEPPASKPGGGGGNPKANPDSNLLTKCQNAKYLENEFTKIEALVSTPFSTRKRNVLEARAKYSELYPFAENNLGSSFTNLIRSPINATELYRVTEFQIKTAEESSAPDYRSAYLSVQSAANSGKIASKAIANSKECKDVIAQANSLNKEEAKNRECDSRKLGGNCKNFGRAKAAVTCSGIRLICDGNTFQLPKNIRV